MTTYTQKKTRMFMERPEWLKPERRRSESRLKTYPSSTDVRNWCDTVEDRRQHILELVVKGYDKCSSKLIPWGVIVDMLLAMANADVKKLKNCLKQIWTFIYGLDLPEDDLKKLKLMTKKMDTICTDMAEFSKMKKQPDECEPECVAAKRHMEEKADIEELVKGTVSETASTPTIQARMHGPGRMVTRIKGLQPGFQVIDDPTTPTHISIKPSKRIDPSKSSSETSKKPSEMSAMRVDPTKSPSETSKKPSEMSAKRVDPTKSPSETSKKPSEMSATKSSSETSKKPSEMSAKRVDPTKSPSETSKKPSEMSAKRVDPTKSSSETSKKPSEMSAKRVDPTKSSPETSKKPSEISAKLSHTVSERSEVISKSSGNIPKSPESHQVEVEEAVIAKSSQYTTMATPYRSDAVEALCQEQQDKIAELTKERDHLKTKLESCLKELDNFKKLQTVANPSLPASCQQEIEALEAEIKIMRSGNPSPEEEAEIIKKEVEILKRYCSKLKEVENENEKLKVELGSRIAIKDSEFGMTPEKVGDTIGAEKVETLKDKLKDLEELTKERDMLANKVHMLEKQLLQFQDLPADIEQLKNKADMLDSVMEERDSLSQKVKLMKGMEEELQKLKSKADRVDDLERELKNMSKGDRSSGMELKKSQSIAGNLEAELQNVKSERDAMQKRIDNMKKELDGQKAMATEAEMLRLERDRLQIKLNELADVQAQYEDLMNKMKIFDNVNAERDMYKQKYEKVLDMECKCEMLKAQVEEAKTVSRERDHLQKQVEDLEACICEQEDEIKGLVLQVDGLSRTRNESKNRMNTIKEEMVKKDRLLAAASQEQFLQTQNMASRIKELEKLLHNAEHMIIQKDCHIKCLEQEVNCKAGSNVAGKKMNQKEMDSVELMRKELEAAKSENKRLQEIANKMLSITGDDHVKKMLKQSECAVKRVVQELGKQYKEWDHMKTNNPKGKIASNKRGCLCHSAGGELSSGDDCEKLRVELEELQREKQKLEMTVKQLQGEKLSPKGFRCPSSCR